MNIFASINLALTLGCFVFLYSQAIPLMLACLTALHGGILIIPILNLSSFAYRTWLWLYVVMVIVSWTFYAICAGVTLAHLPVGFVALFLTFIVPLVACKILQSQWLWSVCLLAMIWVPFDHRATTALWSTPDNLLSYPFASLLASSTMLLGFRFLRDPSFFTIRFELNFNAVRVTSFYFFLLVALLLPLSFFTGFIDTFKAPVWFRPIAVFLAVALTIALPEELAFRAILQRTLIRRFGYIRGLVVASMLFGLTHWNNGTSQWDWRYLMLASLAGIAYGMSYHRTNNLLVPITIHALVDTTWVNFFK